MALVTEHPDPIVASAAGQSPAWLALVPLALVSAALLFAYREALAAMVSMWDTSPMYSYGYTVPVVSAYLLWSRREAWRALTPRASWAPGAALLLVAIAMTVAARAGGIRIVEQIAFLVALTAAVLLMFGTAYVRVAWAALAYLLLMVPIWDGFTERLHEPFQLRSAGIGVWLLHVIGVPAYREGTFITLPNMQIEVARVCSGVNYLVAVVALGLPLAYVFLRSHWHRAALLGMAVVVAALSNGLRVALICTLAYYDVGSPLHGPFHVLHGLFVAGVGYVVLFVGLGILSRRESRGVAAPEAAVRPAPKGSGQAFGRERAVAAVVVAILFVTVGVNGFSPEQRRVPLAGDLGAIPRQLGAWVSDRTIADEARLSPVWPGTDAQLTRRYMRPDGVTADVYVGYFSLQTQGREVVTYRTTELHNAASLARIAGTRGRVFEANYVPTGRDGIATLFWYEVAGRPEANRFKVKSRTLWGAIARGETSAAVVVLTTKTDAARAAATLQELAPLVEAAVAARLPGGSGEVEE